MLHHAAKCNIFTNMSANCCAIVMTPCSDITFVAALVAAYGLQRVNTKADIVFAVPTSIHLQDSLLKLSNNMGIIVDRVSDSMFVQNMKPAWKWSMVKLLYPLTSLPGIRKIVYDYDNVPLQNFDHLFACEQFSSVNHMSQLNKNGIWAMTAMMRLDYAPSVAMKMISIINHKNVLSEQDIANYFFIENFVSIPLLSMNEQVLERSDLPNRGWFNFSQPHNVHWSDGAKMWFPSFGKIYGKGNEVNCHTRNTCRLWYDRLYTSGIHKHLSKNIWRTQSKCPACCIDRTKYKC